MGDVDGADELLPEPAARYNSLRAELDSITTVESRSVSGVETPPLNSPRLPPSGDQAWPAAAVGQDAESGRSRDTGVPSTASGEPWVLVPGQHTSGATAGSNAGGSSE